jgi:hypothetical protein
MLKVKKKVKLPQSVAVKANTVGGRRGSHVFYAMGSQMEVSLSPLGAAALYSQKSFWCSVLLKVGSIPGP